MVISNGISIVDAKLSVGVGWAHLIDDVYQALPENVAILDVKEKYAALRIDWCANEPYPPDDVQRKFAQFIEDIEQDSLATCEYCTEPGHVRRLQVGWIKTLCDNCAAERMATG